MNLTAEEPMPTKEELAELSELIALWDANEAHLASLAEAVKSAEATKTKIETELIPALMTEAGNIEEFALADGRKVTVREELYASISKANEEAAFAWLEAQGHGAVIKDALTVALGRGPTAAERAQALVAFIEGLGVDEWTRKRGVHPQTLQALLREQLAEGVEVPKATFGVFQQRRAEIKRPRGKGAK